MTYIATFFSHFGAIRYKKLCDAQGFAARTMPGSAQFIQFVRNVRGAVRAVSLPLPACALKRSTDR